MIGNPITAIAAAIKGASGAYSKRQERKARESEAHAAVTTALGQQGADIVIKREHAQSIVQRKAIEDKRSSWKDEFITVVVAVYFFIWPGIAAAVDASFGTLLFNAHLKTLEVLMGITTDSAIGMVFAGVCLTAAGIATIKSFFGR